MIRILSDRKRLEKLYSMPKECIYNQRFFGDLSSGYATLLEETANQIGFFSFEPYDCRISKLVMGERQYDFCNNLDKVITTITFCLIAYGKGYIHIIPEYLTQKEGDETNTRVLSKIRINEIKGFVKKKNHEKLLFCSKKYNGETEEIEMQRKQLIIFDIRDIGFRKRYFINILKKLSKYDIISASTRMINDDLDGYDFSIHSKKYKIQQIKVSKDIGWSFTNDGLSDSYILYKKILKDKLKLQFLEYILKKINLGLEEFMGGSDGKLIVHIKKKNYNQLWNDYSNGIITGSELTNILYHKY